MKLGPRFPTTPHETISIVNRTTAPGAAALDGEAVVARLGNPTSARWLIGHRLTDFQLVLLRQQDTDHPELHLQQYVVLAFRDAETARAATERLGSDPDVISARSNAIGSPSARLNDYYVSQTGPAQIPAGYQWALESVKVMSSWSNPTEASAWDYLRGFGYVGVVDSGIDIGHPDLQTAFRAHFSQAFHSGGCTSSNLTYVDESAAQSTCPTAYRGHGTLVAGLIAASANNTIGVGGVCLDCSLIIARIAPTFPTSDAINGLYHSIIRGAQVINLSGGESSSYLARYGVRSCSQLATGTDGYCDVLAVAQRRNTFIVAATGNANNVAGGGYPATNFPALESGVVGVAATTSTGSIWRDDAVTAPGFVLGSNLDYASLVGPGHRVVSTFYRGGSWNSYCYDARNDGVYAGGYGYDECTGTSFAAPVISGILAMVRSLHPWLQRTTILDAVRTTAQIVENSYKLPNALAAAAGVAQVTNSLLTPLFALGVNKWPPGYHSRLFTAIPQMASAAWYGTMLPLPDNSTTPVYYSSDGNANAIAGYAAFPDISYFSPPRAYNFVFSSSKVVGVELLPLFRLSKLQDVGTGVDACGSPMPVPGKLVPVIHTYTTSVAERDLLQNPVPGNCYKYDGIEGYVSPFPFWTNMEGLYRLYHQGDDHYMLVPASKLGLAYSLGYSQGQVLLGYVVPVN